MTVLEKIAQFVEDTTYEDIPLEVIKTAKMALTDFIAVAVAGCDAPVSQKIHNYIKKFEGDLGECILFGKPEKTNLAAAVLFNGVSAHALDFDDCSWTSLGHPTVSVAPTCFASCQERGWNGKSLIKAYVLAVEGMQQIARLTNPKLSEQGWHTTLAYGVFGATIAASLNYELTASSLINALAIATSRASGVRANFGSMTKALHAGISNSVGVECARLALVGITGKANAIEGQDGFSACFTGKEIHGEVDIGKFWDLKENGVVLKRYPCCSGSHPANDVWDEYLTSHPLKPEDIDHIHAGVSLLSPRELTCHLPQDAIEAKFSLEFALACRLIHGSLKISSFKDEIVKDPAVQSFMKKIKTEISPELAKLGFIGTAPIRLRIFLKNGQVVDLENDLAVGTPEKPLSESALHAKFMDCVVPICGAEKADSWFEILNNLANANAGDLAGLGGA